MSFFSLSLSLSLSLFLCLFVSWFFLSFALRRPLLLLLRGSFLVDVVVVVDAELPQRVVEVPGQDVPVVGVGHGRQTQRLGQTKVSPPPTNQRPDPPTDAPRKKETKTTTTKKMKKEEENDDHVDVDVDDDR